MTKRYRLMKEILNEAKRNPDYKLIVKLSEDNNQQDFLKALVILDAMRLVEIRSEEKIETGTVLYLARITEKGIVAKFLPFWWVVLWIKNHWPFLAAIGGLLVVVPEDVRILMGKKVGIVLANFFCLFDEFYGWNFNLCIMVQ